MNSITFGRYLRYFYLKQNKLKHLLSVALFLILCQKSIGQQLFLKINGSSEVESKTIDSLNYNRIHKNISSIESEILFTAKKLEQIGYLESTKKELIKKNDSIFSIDFELNKQTKYAHIYIGKNTIIKSLIKNPINKDSLILKYTETATFLSEIILEAEKAGYPSAKTKLENIKKRNNILIADLSIKLNSQRKINQIILKSKEEKGTTKDFPNNLLTQINKKFKNKLLNKSSIKEIEKEFDKYPFTRQTKQPELLLSKDSTIVYVYLEKKKSNSFDGYIGINNNEEQKTVLNGYLDIQLQNMLNKGEDFFIYWKSDGNNQKTFRSGITLHYLFKTPLGIHAQLNIFRQDSTFQNSKTFLDVNYLLDYKTKLYIGIESTTSSDIQNNNNTINDYNNQFITTGLTYQKNDTKNPLFEEKTKLEIRIGIGNRNTSNTNSNTSNEKQYFANLYLNHNFHINQKNSINIRSQNFYLNSKTYLTNELFRFGGLYSVRGFAENSLQGNYVNALLTEYRYLLNQSLYIHSVLDFAIFKDPLTLLNRNNFNKIKSIGLGIGIQSKGGLIKFSITNGINNDNDIKLFNSIINICYNVKF